MENFNILKILKFQYFEITYTKYTKSSIFALCAHYHMSRFSGGGG